RARPSTSVAPPAENGTMMRTTLSGHCAKAGAASSGPMPMHAARSFAARRRATQIRGVSFIEVFIELVGRRSRKVGVAKAKASPRARAARFMGLVGPRGWAGALAGADDRQSRSVRAGRNRSQCFEQQLREM